LSALFYQNLSRFGKAPAVSCRLSSGALSNLSYEALQQTVDAFKSTLPSARSLCAIECQNDLSTLVAYLACLQLNHPVLLLDKQTSEQQKEGIKTAYFPDAFINDGVVHHIDYSNNKKDIKHTLDDRLAVLLSTSGSTGSPKQVALSYDNLQQNCLSICEYLPIKSDDVVITMLPFNYSYGLSIIHTHLSQGAKIVMSDYSVIDKAFWALLEEEQVTTLSGVPYTYEMLIRLGLVKKELPFLRYFTQAGGKLAEKRVSLLAEFGETSHSPFYVMYGQTEATARMAYVEPSILLNKPGTIGKPIPGGDFSLVNESGEAIVEPHQVGELVYRGKNVMLGYATSRRELTEFNATEYLKTGDLAYFDEDGDFFITGRLKRFIKVFGKRIALDEVESWLKNQMLDVAVIGTDNKLQVAVTVDSMNKTLLDKAMLLKQVTDELSIHHSTVKIFQVESLPKTPNGKLDYKALEQQLS